MPSASTASISCNTRSTFGQPDSRSRISPPGLIIGHGRAALPWYGRAQDVDARQDRSEVVGHPSHESKDAAGSEGQDAAAMVENLLRYWPTETNSILDTFLEPQELNRREVVHDERSRFAFWTGEIGFAKLCAGSRKPHVFVSPRRLCTAEKLPRSVRRNPKDFWLVKLRRLERA